MHMPRRSIRIQCTGAIPPLWIGEGSTNTREWMRTYFSNLFKVAFRACGFSLHCFVRKTEETLLDSFLARAITLLRFWVSYFSVLLNEILYFPRNWRVTGSTLASGSIAYFAYRAFTGVWALCVRASVRVYVCVSVLCTYACQASSASAYYQWKSNARTVTNRSCLWIALLNERIVALDLYHDKWSNSLASHPRTRVQEKDRSSL